MKPKIWVGIDAGKTAHHACAVDSDGMVCWSQKLANDQEPVEELIARATDTATEVCWGVDLIDSSAALLVAGLIAANQRVLYVPGRVVNRMSGVFRGEAKSDAKDARVIAETARMHPDLKVLSAPDDLVVELGRLTAHRTDLMADWVRGINRLRDMLTGIFPALERAFDYSTRSALILVARFQTPAAIRNAGADDLPQYLAEHGARGVPTLVAKALAAAEGQTMQLPGETTTAKLVARQAQKLLELNREIKGVNKLITERFRTHAKAKIIESLPGLGPILGAEFVVAIGGALETFGSSGRLASYAGLVPVPRDSGRVTGNLHRPQRYDRRLRRVFYMAALSSLKTNGPSRVFYDKKRGEHKHHIQALLALARRLVDVLWALLRDNRTFTQAAPVPTSISSRA